jgi:hypothetical protein
MQSAPDPSEERALLDELISGGIAALVAERIGQRKGEHMDTATEAEAETTNSGSPKPEPVVDDPCMTRQLGAIR